MTSSDPAGLSCTYLSRCPVWDKFQTNSKLFWIKQYCEEPKQEYCAQRKLAAEGMDVPEDLLPNGDTLS